MPRKSKQKWEYGDFQTPESLATQAVSVLANLGIAPQSIIEPTCGRGSFIVAAARKFRTAKRLIGADVNPEYLSLIKPNLSKLGLQDKMTLITGDFFSLD